MDVTNGKQEQEHARRVRLAVTIGGHDATDALAPSLLSATYADNALTDGLRETKKTQAWEGYSLQAVAGEIAQRNGLELLYNADAFPFNRQDQREESDLPFLQRLASARGGERQGP